MASLNVGFKFGQRRKQRESDSLELARLLINSGVEDPEVINQVVGNYVKSGKFEIPSSRKELVPPKIGIGPQNQVEEPIKLGARTQDVFTIGPDGKLTLAGGVGKGSKVLRTQPDTQQVFQYDANGNLVPIGSVPKGSKVTPKPKPEVDKDREKIIDRLEKLQAVRDSYLRIDEEVPANVDAEIQALLDENPDVPFEFVDQTAKGKGFFGGEKDIKIKVFRRKGQKAPAKTPPPKKGAVKGVPKFDSMEAAEAADLPKGTIVEVQGRKFRVE